MKVAFICDYFYPEEVSGAEISARFLAESLAKKLDVLLILPNFSGLPAREVKADIQVARFPTLRVKIRPAPSWLTENPFWFLTSAYQIRKLLVKENPDVLHIQGKNVLLPAFLANIFLRKPFLVTARDYRLLCNLGTCLLMGSRVCNWRRYLLNDIPSYFRLYARQNVGSLIFLYLVGIYQLFLRPVQRFILGRSLRVICLSVAQEKIFRDAGVKNTMVIYNQADVSIKRNEKKKRVIFVGRYTPGKGKPILNELIPWFLDQYPDWEFVIVSASYKETFSHPRLMVYKKISHQEVSELISRSAVTIVPSIWPEPFGRVALESIAVGTPVLASRAGGLPEIVSDEISGLVVNPDLESFKKGLKKMARHYQKYSQNIWQGKKKIWKTFSQEPLAKHLALYQGLVKHDQEKKRIY